MSPRFLRVAIGCWALVGALLSAVPATAADRQLLLDDVLRMHQAGLSDNIIASEILVTESVFELTVDDLLRLKELGLSEDLIQFLVDTGLPAEEFSDTSDPESETYRSEDAGDADEESYARLWVNVIEEKPAPTYFVTLDYDYPYWWYDSYWNDYWYYDHHYYPYQFSFSWTSGCWYPGWYSYRSCYLPSYWGYRSHYYARAGYRWGYDRCPSYYSSGGYYTEQAHYTYPHSRTKYKSGGSSGKVLYADAGLKVPDLWRGTKTPVAVDSRRPGKRPTKRLVVSDGPGLGDDVRRPIKTVSSLDTRPARPIRRPSGGGLVKERPVDISGGGRRPAAQIPTRKITRRPHTPTSVDRPVKVDEPDRGGRRPDQPVVRTPRDTKPPVVDPPRDTRRPVTQKPADPRPPIKVSPPKRPTDQKPTTQRPANRKSPKPVVQEAPKPQRPPAASAPSPPAKSVKPAPARNSGSRKAPPQQQAPKKSRARSR